MATAPTSFASPLIAALRGGISDTGSASTVSLLPNMAPNYSGAATFKPTARTGNINNVQPFGAMPPVPISDSQITDPQMFGEGDLLDFDPVIATYQEPFYFRQQDQYIQKPNDIPDEDVPQQDIVIPDWDVLPPEDKTIPDWDVLPQEDVVIPDWDVLPQEPAPSPAPVEDVVIPDWDLLPDPIEQPAPETPDYTYGLGTPMEMPMKEPELTPEDYALLQMMYANEFMA